MQLSPKLTYEVFSAAADQLYYQAMEMPTAGKTHAIIGHGSLATHQHYLNRWKEHRKKKPTTLPEQLSQKIREKSEAYADEIWKALTKTQQETHHKIQQSAKQVIEKAEAEIKEAVLAKQKSEENLKSLEVKYQALQEDHKKAVESGAQSEKRGIVLEEKNRALEQQIENLKMEMAQQLKYLQEQDQKNRELFKEQLNEQAQKYEHQYLALQKEKDTEKANAEKTIDKIQAEKKQLESKLFEQKTEIEKSKVEIHHLKQLLQNMEKDKKAFFEENKMLTTDLHKKENQINLVQGEKNALQQQLSECKNKIIILQKEKISLEELKNKLTKKIKPHSNE